MLSNVIFKSLVKSGTSISYVQSNIIDELIHFNNGSVKHGIYAHHLTNELGWKGLFSVDGIIQR